MMKPQTKNILWHGGKALLCSLQLYVLNLLDQPAVISVAYVLMDLTIRRYHDPASTLLYPVVTVILFAVLWRYYDTIDDRSFHQFCRRNSESSPASHLLGDIGFQTNLVVTVLSATPILVTTLRPALMKLGLDGGPAMAVAIALSAGIVALLSVLRIRRLEEIWMVQKDLLSQKVSLRNRIFYAVVYFGALALLLQAGVYLLMTWVSFMISVLQLAFQNHVGSVLLCILLPFLAIGLIRRLIQRNKFMRRLANMQKRNEITYTVHGHPYLSVLFPRIHFGLHIIDTPHADAKRPEYKAYTVGIITCRRRMGTIVLCDNNVYRFMYALTLRGVGGFRVGANLLAGAQIVTVPAGAWYTNHTFTFPEGEGEPILLIDPTPRVLAIHGQRPDELIPQDNASQVYGYTVYGKNAFLNMLERT